VATPGADDLTGGLGYA